MMTKTPDTLPALLESLTAAGYAPTPKAAIEVRSTCGRVMIFDVIVFTKGTCVVTVLVKGSGATVAEALETARVKIIEPLATAKK